MRIPDCPKRLSSCNSYCPQYPCWAYDKHMNTQDREKKENNTGWD
ncbi:MAG: hypothetical protein U9R08_04080 [Nanoarchaeota archaeon]|nr:hypothetical protein [Nanoarchaeota archaeon]